MPKYMEVMATIVFPLLTALMVGLLLGGILKKRPTVECTCQFKEPQTILLGTDCE